MQFIDIGSEYSNAASDIIIEHYKKDNFIPNSLDEVLDYFIEFRSFGDMFEFIKDHYQFDALKDFKKSERYGFIKKLKNGNGFLLFADLWSE